MLLRGGADRGVEKHVVDSITVHVTGIAKTVADYFKYRNKIGLDMALAALREAWNAKRMTSDEIWHYAKIDRVANVMQPYLESLAWTSATSPRRFVPGCSTRPVPRSSTSTCCSPATRWSGCCTT